MITVHFSELVKRLSIPRILGVGINNRLGILIVTYSVLIVRNVIENVSFLSGTVNIAVIEVFNNLAVFVHIRNENAAIFCRNLIYRLIIYAGVILLTSLGRNRHIGKDFKVAGGIEAFPIICGVYSYEQRPDKRERKKHYQCNQTYYGQSGTEKSFRYQSSGRYDTHSVRK